MKNCPKCHSENPDEAKFCLECGTAFPAGAQKDEIEIELEENVPETPNKEEAETLSELEELEEAQELMEEIEAIEELEEASEAAVLQESETSEPEKPEETETEEVEDIFGSRVEGLEQAKEPFFQTIEEISEPGEMATEEVLSFGESKESAEPEEPKAPEALKSEEKPEEKIWYFVENNESKGSFDRSQMKEFLDSGRIHAQTYVWKPGFSDWEHLDQTELKSLIPVKEEPEKKSAAQAKQPEPEPVPVSSVEWYFVENNEARGPYNEEQMVQMVKNQVLHGDDYVWNEDYVSWTPLAQTPLALYIPAKPAPESEPALPNAAPSSAASQPLSAGNSGLLPHSLLTNLLLCVFTCGIYEYFWIYQEARDVNILARQRGLQPMMEPGLVVFLTIITCGLFGIYFFYKSLSLLNEIIYPGQNKSTEVILITALAVFIPVFAIVPMCIIQDNLNHVIEQS